MKSYRTLDDLQSLMSAHIRPGGPDDLGTLRDQLHRYQDEVLAKLS